MRGAASFLISIFLAAVVFLGFTGIARPFVWTSTRYGPGYSETRFRKIHLGAAEKEVRSALSVPLAEFTNTDSQVTLIYSFQDPKGLSMFFRHRSLVLSNGVVVVKTSLINSD